MPLRIGMLAYPLFIIGLQAARSNAVAAFEKASAYTVETSRRPTNLQVTMKATARAVRKRLLVPVGDGRYYLDRAALRRADRKNLLLLALGTAAFIPIILLLV